MHCALLSNLDQGFGRRQTDRCYPGLHGGTLQKTTKGPQKEERLRTVLLLVSMRAITLASGMIGPALMLFTIFVKEVSELKSF